MFFTPIASPASSAMRRAYREQCAVQIQATYRGYRARQQYQAIRELVPPEHPALRRRWVAGKLERRTEELVNMVQNASLDVDSLFAELDATASAAAAIYSRLPGADSSPPLPSIAASDRSGAREDPTRTVHIGEASSQSKSKSCRAGDATCGGPSTADWEAITAAALNRDSQPECAICLGLIARDLGQERSSAAPEVFEQPLPVKKACSGRLASNEETAGDKESALFKELKASQPFFLMAGPNVIQSEEHCMKMCRLIKSVTDSLGLKLVFKSSFDKANRTSATSFRGPGMEEGLRVLKKVKETYGVPIITDIHESWQAEKVAEVADILQIPAFLCRQTDLLVAAAKTGKIIHIKKGQFCASSVMRNSAEKCRAAGNPNVMVCERGSMFGYSDLVVDPRNLVFMRDAGCPVTADITHSLQQPAGRALEGGAVASGGLRDMIPAISRMAVAVGVDGLFMEVHDNPDSSPVDGPTQWPLRHLRRLLVELLAIAKASHGRVPFPLDLSPLEEEGFDPLTEQ
ncbi:hypothetical protein N2152v2_001282 [Parachlorella kessleri]